ncbi:MAG: hypothetical protein ABR542_00320 [Desulfonatronovibrio sp.]|nr:hypothetical protein [Desulfovibrionales bacterium]
MKLFFFCILYTLICIWAQYFLPSMDFFVPVLVVMLQLGFFQAAAWAGLFWMFIHEGTGGLAFGTVILFYAGLLIIFFLGGVFFEISNILFTMFLMLFAAVYKNWIISVMATLQGLYLPSQFSMINILLQAGIYIAAWLITFTLFKKHFLNEPVQRK